MLKGMTFEAALTSRPWNERVPAPVYFATSTVFHYLGPAFAVLLFARIGETGVAWLRIATAAACFAAWRRPWRAIRGVPPGLLLTFGATLGAMNVLFYLAISRVPLGTVAAIEFLGPVILAALVLQTGRNVAALLAVVAGVVLLADVRLEGEPLGVLFAFGNCAGFLLYIVLGHRLARDGGAEGIDRLGLSMLVAAVLVAPFGAGQAAPAFGDPVLLAAAAGVGVCSSVIPYVCDQLAMSRLARATFALMLALMPATAMLIGLAVLRQVPGPLEVAGVLLVVAGIAVHRQLPQTTPQATPQTARQAEESG